jgi:hypothetical protein
MMFLTVVDIMVIIIIIIIIIIICSLVIFLSMRRLVTVAIMSVVDVIIIIAVVIVMLIYCFVGTRLSIIDTCQRVADIIFMVILASFAIALLTEDQMRRSMSMP